MHILRTHPGCLAEMVTSQHQYLFLVGDASGDYLRVHNYKISSYVMYLELSVILLKPNLKIQPRYNPISKHIPSTSA